MVMESASSRYFGNDPCQRSRDHCEFGTDQRYGGLAEVSQPPSFVLIFRATAIFGQVTYPLEQGYGLQHTAPPHIQNNSNQHDTEYPSINQRQHRYPAYSSSLMYNTVVETPVVPSKGQHPSNFDSVQQHYSSSNPPSPSALDIPTHQFDVPQHYYNATGQSPSSLMNVVPAYSIVQRQPMDQSPYQGSRASTTRQSITAVAPLYQSSIDAHNMSNALPASALAAYFYGDANYERFVETARRVYRYVQAGRLQAAATYTLELSGWLMKVLNRAGKWVGQQISSSAKLTSFFPRTNTR